jgi:diaminopimelate decarboxylase
MSSRIFSPETADDRFAAVRRVCDALHAGNVCVVPAYSVKTNPDERMLTAAYRHGMLAEVISGDEVRHAERAGFAPAQLVYNGPRPPAPQRPLFGFCFADSLEALEWQLSRPVAATPGVRLRPSMLGSSRFGVPVAEDESLVAVLRRYTGPLAISMHARREDYGRATWRDVCVDILSRAARIERETGARVVAIDTGGGWEPRQFDAEFPFDGRWLVAAIHETLPAVETVLIEPGQAIATPVESLLALVIEVRRRPGRLDVVCDLGYNDWPSQNGHKHEIAIARGDRWIALGHGADRLLGATCLEYDMVEGLRFPPDVVTGDRLMVHDVGAYDTSMAFSFGRGVLGGSVPEHAAR